MPLSEHEITESLNVPPQASPSRPRVPRYVALARALAALNRCIETKNGEWEKRWSRTIQRLLLAFPCSGGFDSGTSLLGSSKENKLVFQCEYRHLDNNGMYSGWTEHKVIVTPSLTFGFELKITGKNRNQIKDYIADVFSECLREMCDEFPVNGETP